MSNVLETNKMMEDVLRSLGLGPNPSSEELLNGMKDAIGQQSQNTYKQGLLGNAPQEYSAGVNVDAPMTVGGVDINQSAPVQYSGGTFQGGLLGQTPATQMFPADNTAQQALEHLSSKNEQNTQQMTQMQQDAVQQGVNAANQLQAQRQADMSNTEEQARQALQRQQQQESGLGGLLGTGLRFLLTGGTGIWGKKKK